MRREEESRVRWAASGCGGRGRKLGEKEGARGGFCSRGPIPGSASRAASER